MKKLNLISIRDSEVKYEYRHYPDGQQDIIILEQDCTFNSEGGNHHKFKGKLDTSESIEIQSRLNSFMDIEKIICAKKSLDRLGVKDISLYIPYLLGARSDRKFVIGGNSYLVDVVAPIINSLNFNEVISIDIHSDVAAACINNFKSLDNFNLLEYVFNTTKIKNPIFISPDAGAIKKVFEVAKRFKVPFITASKYRDLKTGNITSTDVNIELYKLDSNISFIVVDDICDGGRTFVELAKVIHSQHDTVKMYLIVTHGIFSNGYKELSQYFDGIFCTNSVKDCGDYWGNDLEKTNVKQLKVI